MASCLQKRCRKKKIQKVVQSKERSFFVIFFRFCLESKLQNHRKKGEMLVVVLILIHWLNFFIFVVSAGISLLSSSLMPYRTLLTSCDDMNIFMVPVFQPHGGNFHNYTFLSLIQFTVHMQISVELCLQRCEISCHEIFLFALRSVQYFVTLCDNLQH